MKLSIVIPHYKEPFEMVDKLLKSIDNQRLISREAVEVLIVNDCGTPLKAKELIYRNFKPILLKTKKNGGAGVARQYGIEHSHGEYIMFIDADDLLTNHALFYVLSKIHEKPDADFIWGDFIEEGIFEEQNFLYLHANDLTFCHGKVYKREFLEKNNIKCHPVLRYNEDAYFNALVFHVVDKDKIERIEQPLVIWCNNRISTVRNGGLYAYRELPSFVLGMNDLCVQMEQRKIPNGTQFLQALFYIYFQLQDKAWQHKRVYEFRPAVIESCKKFFNRFRKIYEEVGETELMNLYDAERKRFKSPVMERNTFFDFIKEIQ